MLKSTDIFEKIAEMIAKSLIIHAFCQNKFQKGITIYIGLEQEFQPPGEDYPLIVIVAVDRAERGNQTQQNVLTASLGIGIKTSENAIEEIAILETGAKIKKYHGIFLIEELRILVEQEILTMPGVGAKISVTGETFLQNLFPLFKSSSTIQFEMPKSFRNGR